MIGETVCHYRIIEELGGGGMGVVYRAEDTRLKRTVALKFLSPELTRDERAKRRFVIEAQAASQLDHPNICTIHDIEETEDGQLFLVLSCYNGETVRDRLEKGPMPIDEAVGLAMHVARGLEEAHSKGIIHRDIKPANIFLTDDGRAKILDFGLAKLAGQTKITRVGSTVGTVAYMSPEQAHGGDVQTQTDIWSLGVVLYEALTGGLPFPGERPESVLYSVVHEEPEPLGALRHDVPPELEAIIDKCLKKNPEERFERAGQLAASLEPLRHGRTSGSSLIEIGSTTRIPVGPARRRGLVVATIVLALACVGLFALPEGRSAVRRGSNVVRSWFGGTELPELKQLAVLPFQDASDESNEAFVAGLNRYLTSRLSQLEQFEPGFRVIPARELVDHGVTTPTEALAVSGATLALVGTVDRDGDNVGIGLEVIDTSSRRTLRSWRRRDNLANVAAFQGDPVTATADMLELTPQKTSRRVLTAGNTTVPGALDAYLRGLGRLSAAGDDSTDHIADAVALFDEAVTLDPSYALAHVGLGRSYWSAFKTTKDPENARRALESARLAMGLDDRLASAHIVAGLVEDHNEDFPAAVHEFRRALDIDPVNQEARHHLARVNESAGDFALAEIAYKEAIDVRRKRWASHYALGYYYYGRGRNEDALRVLGKASALAPGNPWPYMLIGCIYYDTDRLDEAWIMMERSAEVAPSREAYSNLGTFFFAEARYADAARMYEEALELDDTGSNTWGNLAAACNVVPGKEKRASECYTRALELAQEELKLTPRDAALLAVTASYCAELGDTARARDLLSRSVELQPDDDQVMFQVGLTHEILGHRDEALLWIGRSLENGYSRDQVESTPSLRDLCTDERYQRLVRRGGGR